MRQALSPFRQTFATGFMISEETKKEYYQELIAKNSEQKSPFLEGGQSILRASWLDTPLGHMLAIGDEEALYLLEFVDYRKLDREVERLSRRTQLAIIPGDTKTTRAIEEELTLYFEGKLKEFKTPLRLFGSPFQQTVWEELKKIPFGETRSYADIAAALHKPSAFRAVAQANGANQLAIIIPCHRVINANGDLGGYGGGLLRKKRLLDLEKTSS